MEVSIPSKHSWEKNDGITFWFKVRSFKTLKQHQDLGNITMNVWIKKENYQFIWYLVEAIIPKKISRQPKSWTTWWASGRTNTVWLGINIYHVDLYSWLWKFRKLAVLGVANIAYDDIAVYQDFKDQLRRNKHGSYKTGLM